MAKTSTQRKRDQRAALAALGIKPKTILLGETGRRHLAWCCEVRGGASGPYDESEYIETLIRADVRRLKKQLKRLGHCDTCLNPLPGGCGGEKKGQSDCPYRQIDRRLRLKA
jgi:hypothetical protein